MFRPVCWRSESTKASPTRPRPAGLVGAAREDHLGVGAVEGVRERRDARVDEQAGGGDQGGRAQADPATG